MLIRSKLKTVIIKIIKPHVRVLHKAPLTSDFGILKSVFLPKLLPDIPEFVSFDSLSSCAVITHCEPAVLVERHRYEIDFSACNVVHHPHIYHSESKMNTPEAAVFVLHKITVTAPLYLVSTEISVCEDWVVRIILKRTVRGLALGVDYHMTVFRTALSRHKIVFALYFVEMRAFKETSACTCPYGLAWRELFACFDIYFALCNAMVALIVFTIGHKVGFAVLKIQ